MHKLEHQTSIDFLSKYCKIEEHKKCHGIWTGLGFRVNCNCSCHHDNMLSFDGIKNYDNINSLKENNNFKTTINALSSTFSNSSSNKNNDISERETSNLHFSLTSSSSQKRSLKHNIESNGDPTHA